LISRRCHHPGRAIPARVPGLLLSSNEINRFDAKTLDLWTKLFEEGLLPST